MVLFEIEILKIFGVSTKLPKCYNSKVEITYVTLLHEVIALVTVVKCYHTFTNVVLWKVLVLQECIHVR
jgi:recombinational DNA repair protein (RecF pathway)